MKLARGPKATPEEQWQETTATIFSSAYCYADRSDLADGDWGLDESYFLNAFSYRVDGELYVSDYRSYDEQQTGEEFTISYDPADPNYNSLTGPKQSAAMQVAAWGLVLLLGILFLFLLQHFGTRDLPISISRYTHPYFPFRGTQ